MKRYLRKNKVKEPRERGEGNVVGGLGGGVEGRMKSSEMTGRENMD